MKQFTGAQKGGGEGEVIVRREESERREGGDGPSLGTGDGSSSGSGMGGRRRGKNSWLSHVKATMKMHRGKSFKQVLKLAKKSYKKSQSQSQSQSQSGGRRRKSKVSNKRRQRGGSSFAENAAAYPN